MSTRELCVVGYVSIDLIRDVGGRWHACIGGAAVYAALAAARLGVTPRLFAAVGEDFPERWLQTLDDLGIDTAALESREGRTRRTRLRYGPDEERVAATERDASWWERTAALEPPLPPSGTDTCLVCPVPASVVRRVVTRCRYVIADTSEAFAVRGVDRLGDFSGVDVFAPSLAEGRSLTGAQEPESVLEHLLTAVPTAFLKCGAAGLLRMREGQLLRCSPPPLEAVDPTGAGDAAVGSIAAAIVLGYPPERQLRVGTEGAMLAIMGHGPIGLGWCN